MDLQRQKMLREDFLVALWEAHAGNYGGDQSTREVCQKIGIDYDTEGSVIGQYLYKRGFVKWSSFDWVSLTTEGIIEAERLVEEREKLSEDSISASAASMPIECPKCNYVVRSSARFCDNCGVSLTKFADTTLEEKRDDFSQTVASDDLVGRVLDGKYKIIVRLDHGGVGAVYRADHLNIGGDVAIKVLHAQFVADPSFMERFRREARAAAQIHHHNIVRIFDFVEARDNSPAFIVMEYVPGRSLKTVLQRDGRLESSRAISLMREICAAVGAAHNVAITHRDIKPANIIIAEPSADTLAESIKLIDFGVAKAPRLTDGQDITLAGSVIGTPQYMSPEQCRGDATDARSDVYSLGVILYEMLTGRPPFTAGTNADIVSQHLRDTPPALPRQLKISDALQRVLFRALAKEPNARQTDALLLSRELAQATTYESSSENTASVSEATTLGMAVPRPSSAVGGFYNLQDLDVKVLKRSCEMAIDRGYLKHIDVRSLLNEIDSLRITREELFDSLEVLSSESYIEPSKTIGGGLPINDFEITEFGFEQYAQEFIPNYQSIVDRVVNEIVQDGKEAYDKPELVVEHVLDHFASRGSLKLSKRLGGKIVIIHVSAQMKRQYRNAVAATPAVESSKSKYYSEVASQIGDELRFRSRRKKWFSSEEGQASAKKEIEKLHQHLETLAKEISENDRDVNVTAESDGQGFMILRCRGISLTSSWNPGRFANTLNGSVLHKKLLDGRVVLELDVVDFEEKPKELSSTDYDIDMSPDGTIGWRVRNGRDNRVFTSHDIAESWINDLMNYVQKKLIEEDA